MKPRDSSKWLPISSYDERDLYSRKSSCKSLPAIIWAQLRIPHSSCYSKQRLQSHQAPFFTGNETIEGSSFFNMEVFAILCMILSWSCLGGYTWVKSWNSFPAFYTFSHPKKKAGSWQNSATYVIVLSSPILGFRWFQCVLCTWKAVLGGQKSST